MLTLKRCRRVCVTVESLKALDFNVLLDKFVKQYVHLIYFALTDVTDSGNKYSIYLQFNESVHLSNLDQFIKKTLLFDSNTLYSRYDQPMGVKQSFGSFSCRGLAKVKTEDQPETSMISINHERRTGGARTRRVCLSIEAHSVPTLEHIVTLLHVYKNLSYCGISNSQNLNDGMKVYHIYLQFKESVCRSSLKKNTQAIPGSITFAGYQLPEDILHSWGAFAQHVCKHQGDPHCSAMNTDGSKCNTLVASGGIDALCQKHGGGRRCSAVEEDHSPCPSGAEKGGLCKRHGGGRRCEDECCLVWPAIAEGRHPDTGMYMCTQAMRQAVIVASELGRAEEERLNRHFGFKRTLINRGELIFYHALVLAVPELKLSERVLDKSLLTACLGKRKSIHDARPDYFHYFSDGSIQLALHGEYDESIDHEDCDKRLTAIADTSGCGPDNVYVFRVQGHHGTSREVCKRHVVKKDHVYFKLTSEGQRVVTETAMILRERLEWIAHGLAPDDTVGRIRKVYINF